MIYWSYLVLIDLLLPCVMVVCGMIFRKHPPRHPSGIWGYRTRRSLKSRESWDYANRYVGNIWYRWGLILLPLSVIPMLFVLGAEPGTLSAVTVVVCLLQLIPVIGANILTEKALKEHFDQDGSRKDISEPAE